MFPGNIDAWVKYDRSINPAFQRKSIGHDIAILKKARRWLVIPGVSRIAAASQENGPPFPIFADLVGKG